MKKISRLLVVAMLCTVFQFTGSFVYADVPYSGTVLASGLVSSIGIVIGPDDKVYVSDYAGNKIMKMDKDGSNLTTMTTHVLEPVGIAFDNSGNLIVAEHTNSRITRVDSGGNATYIKGGLGFVTGVAVDSHNKIFVVSFSTGKIYSMDADGSNSAEFTTVLNGASPVKSSLIGLGIDANDNLYVSDQNNNRIIKIDPSGVQSDFASVSFPYWASVGKDGYVYASSRDKTIKKFDLSGNKIETYSTGNYTPWGTQVDTGGGIYFAYKGSTVNKILGYADTLDRTHIKITLFYDLVSGTADASAFTVSGVSSNPQVTSAVVNGSEIDLVLDDNIESTDTTIKVSYTKTGTNNLVQQGTSIDLDSFSNLPVINHIVSVASVGTLSTINVANGTTLSAVGLPATVSVNLSNSTTATTSAAVVWDDGTPLYDGNTTGTYTFSGTLTLGTNIYNPEDKKATVNVVVADMLSCDATLKASSTAKGQTVTSLGTPHGTLGSEIAGVVTIAAAKAADTSNAGSFITLFDKNNANATVKVVKYASGTSTANFATDTAYANEAISNGDFFIIKVIAQDTTTVNYYRVNVTVTPASSGSSSGGGGGSTTTGQSSVNIVVNGKTENAGTETRSTESGKSTVTVAVNNKTIESKIEEAVKTNTTGQQNVIQVPVTDTKSEVVKVELTGDVVKQLETNTFDVSVKRDAVEYVIPAKELTISNVAKELGVAETSLKDIKVEVKITKLDDSVVAKYNEVAKENGATIVFPPTAFEVVAKTTNAAGKTEAIKISKFSNYVERVMEIPSGVDPSKITTGIVFNADGTYSHVPTDIYQSNGKWYAKVNSLTNSNYSVVWNPVTVKSVEKHWAKEVVNDMASRLVIFNTETFEPNKAITRADFAEYIVRALGIYREGSHENKFKDVSAAGDRTLAVLIANEYGIVTGYSDGTFRGDNQITREEAMTMYQRAMKITDLTGTDTKRYQSYTDYGQVSKWATPYVNDVLSAHVFNGITATTISPKANLTYAEAAQAIKNLLVESKLINK